MCAFSQFVIYNINLTISCSDQLKDGAEFEVIGDPEQLKKEQEEQAKEQEKKEEQSSSSSTSAATATTSLFPPTGQNCIRIIYIIDSYSVVNDHWEGFLSYYHYHHYPIDQEHYKIKEAAKKQVC